MRDIQEPPRKVWLVWSNDARAWWGTSGCGYVSDVWQAGRYSEEEARDLCGRRTWKPGAIPPEVMVAAPESDQDKFTVDELRHLADRMRNRIATATTEARAARRRRAGWRGVPPMSDRPNLADTLAEPDNGAMVVTLSGEDYRLYLRNDWEAARWGHDDERWFENADIDNDPLCWRTVMQYATHVWARGDLLASDQSGEATR